MDRGDRAPDFALPCGGQSRRFYGLVGGEPVVVALWEGDTPAEVEALAATGAQVVGIARRPAQVEPQGLVLFEDPDGEVTRAFGGEGGRLVVLGPNLRVAASLALEPASVAAARALLDALTWTAPAREIRHQAPVLFIPDVLPAPVCDFFIRLWRQSQTRATGVELTDDGERRDALRGELKRRRDLVLSDPGLVKQLTATVGRRVLPELRRAMGADDRRFEGFKLACYDAAEGGHFKAHRDNLSPRTAHRRFALSLNLNDGYEGGRLRFPEFGPDLHHPPPGGALVFAGHLLHEVTPVTAGQRFAIISFIYNAARAPAAASSSPDDGPSPGAASDNHL